MGKSVRRKVRKNTRKRIHKSKYIRRKLRKTSRAKKSMKRRRYRGGSEGGSHWRRARKQELQAAVEQRLDEREHAHVMRRAGATRALTREDEIADQAKQRVREGSGEDWMAFKVLIGSALCAALLAV